MQMKIYLFILQLLLVQLKIPQFKAKNWLLADNLVYALWMWRIISLIIAYSVEDQSINQCRT